MECISISGGEVVVPYSHSLVDTMCFMSEHAGLEKGFGSTEARESLNLPALPKVSKLLPFVANGEDLPIRKLVAALYGR